MPSGDCGVLAVGPRALISRLAACAFEPGSVQGNATNPSGAGGSGRPIFNSAMAMRFVVGPRFIPGQEDDDRFRVMSFQAEGLPPLNHLSISGTPNTFCPAGTGVGM